MITITLNQNPPQFRPGETIFGTVVWSDLPSTTTQIATRLIWYTEGKGDQDVEIVADQVDELRDHSGSKPFEFLAPHRPHSFSGKLISLIWAVEVVVFPSQDAERAELTISRTGTEIVLDKSFGEHALKPTFRLKR